MGQIFSGPAVSTDSTPSHAATVPSGTAGAPPSSEMVENSARTHNEFEIDVTLDELFTSLARLEDSPQKSFPIAKNEHRTDLESSVAVGSPALHTSMVAPPSSSSVSNSPLESHEHTQTLPTSLDKTQILENCTPSNSDINVALFSLGSWMSQYGLMNQDGNEERAIAGHPLDPLGTGKLTTLYGNHAYSSREHFGGYRLIQPFKSNTLMTHYNEARGLLLHMMDHFINLPNLHFAISVPVSMEDPDGKVRPWYGLGGLFGTRESHPAKECYNNFCHFFSQVLSESSKGAKICFIPSPVAYLAQTGRSTGLVIDIGDTEIRAVPIIDFDVCWEAASFLPYGTQHMINALREMIRSEQSFRTIRQRGYLEEMLPHLYATTSFNDLTQSTHPNPLEVSQFHQISGGDGRAVYLNRDVRFRALEFFFSPNTAEFAGVHGIGVFASLVLNHLKVLFPERSGQFESNIILTGRIASAPGLSNRLEIELKQKGLSNASVIVPEDCKTNIYGLRSLAEFTSRTACDYFFPAGVMSNDKYEPSWP